eukprot:430264_1
MRSICRHINDSRQYLLFHQRAFASYKFSSADHKQLIEAGNKDGYIILRNHFNKNILQSWSTEFQPLLQKQIKKQNAMNEGEKVGNRGAERYYVTLPFRKPFADPNIFEDPDILAIVEGLVGVDPVMCQLATDTPLYGSQLQDIHRDCPPLFPESEWQKETPSFQLAVNFPLVNVTLENGPFEAAKCTHLLSRNEGLKLIEDGKVKMERLCMEVGDVMIRDVRGLHRGTPNLTNVPRPMVVIGYSRRWLFRPEVGIKIPRDVYEGLSDTGKRLLRFEKIFDMLNEDEDEDYIEFAYDDEGKLIDAYT